MSIAQNKLNTALEKGAETSAYLKAYVNYQMQLKKLEVSSTLGQSIALVTTKIVSGVIISGIIFFGLVAFAFWLSEKIGFPLAFAAMSGTLVLFLLIFLMLKNLLIDVPAKRYVSKTFFKEGLPAEDEAGLKRKIDKLEELIEESTLDIPESIKELKAQDFLPENISGIANRFFNSVGTSSQSDSALLKAVKNVGFTFVLNLIRKRFLKF